MASLKEMRNRIASVKATQKITKAMQMVAAAKLRRSQDLAKAARPYADHMAKVISNLALGLSETETPLLLKGTGRRDIHLLVVAAADRGLAGGFTTSVVRAAKERCGQLLAEGKQVKLICVGRKVRDQMRRFLPEAILETFDMSGEKILTLESVVPIADKILSVFESGGADVVTLFYSHFKNVISQVPVMHPLIPAQIPSKDSGIIPANTPDDPLKGGVYSYEPDAAALLSSLLPRNLKVQLLTALLENRAGFYASQMRAMDSATRNAGDLISSLTLQYNRSRQAQITKELIEIISGAEAI